MIYKYDFSVAGDDFYPEKIIDRLDGDFIVDSFFNPTDKRLYDLGGIYGYGGMSFWHPQKFSTEDNIIEYEKEFLDFIEKNHQLFIDNGVTVLKIFIEIYFDGGQCNFEIFDKDALKKISKLNLSLPVSIYVLEEGEIQKWENEIRLTWKSR